MFASTGGFVVVKWFNGSIARIQLKALEARLQAASQRLERDLRWS